MSKTNPRVAYSVPRDALRPALALLAKITRSQKLPELRVVRFGDGQIASSSLDISAALFWPELRGPVIGVDIRALEEACHKADPGSMLTVTAPEAPDGEIAQISAVVCGAAINYPSPFFEQADLPPLVPPEAKFPSIPQLFDGVAQAALRRALDYVSTDQNRYAIQGACLDTRCIPGRIVGTNGRQLYASRGFNWLNLPMGKTINIPRHSAWNSPLLTGVWMLRASLSCGRPCIEVRCGPWRIVAKLVDSNFPNWEHVAKFPNGPIATAVIYADAAKATSKQLRALPKPANGIAKVSLKVTPGLGLIASVPDTTISFEVPAAITGGPCEGLFSAAHLADILDLGHTKWELRGEDCAMQSGGGNGDMLLTMPFAPPLPPQAAPAEKPENISDETPPAANAA